ncbi:MAG: hypothetical protein IPJ81_11570 [Chitinophagaceae bacterium]|nr:hypothetical protein [Chitinophagaceae bacterium]
MKKVIWVCCISLLSIYAKSQEQVVVAEEAKKGGFKKENLFTGGSLNVSFFNGTTVLGVSPYFGYSINRYVDVAISGNINYTSQRDNTVIGDKLRQTVYGPGAFARIFPVNFLFAQVQYEHNFIKLKYKPAPNSGFEPFEDKVDVNSVLIGGGYSSGRQKGNSTYYYVSVLWDVSKLAASPYIDGLGRNFPLVRAGFNIALFQGRSSF